ncbi:unnamed protein product [Adineta ricciae]|uniref:F-box domain-containing protein n=1 Tax=Adineta ricciae TaxID=249248 RepID=A0A815RNF8_ADIRI|nr:unnamed protein product [Adineta ricciae]
MLLEVFSVFLDLNTKLSKELAEDAKQYGVDLFIMVDNNDVNISTINVSSNIRLLQISREKCLQHNYHKAINTGGTWRYITSWDKSLLYFCLLNRNYSFVWLLEEDVFIPNVQVFRSLHELYSKTTDLVVPHHTLNLIAADGLWRWAMASGKFLPPWACSMVNGIGFSQRMLLAIDNYIQWFGEIPFHEFFFNTLAVQLNFTIVVPTELNTIEYATPYFYRDVRQQPNNMWHPIKDYPLGKTWRRSLANESLTYNYTFDLTHLQMLCNGNRKTTNLDQYFNETFVHFESIKGNFSTDTRRSWRQRFSDLAQECQKQNVSQEIVSFIMKLADHAYKLPEPPVPALVTRKSELHIHLEQEINETKRAIYKFTTNGTTVTELRNKIVELIKKLTVEMRREIFEEEKLRNQTTTLSTVTSPSTTTTTSSTSSPVQATIRMKNEHYDESGPDMHHRITNTHVMMKFDFLPNEILIQCFAYLNAPDIFHCFNNLNSRLNQLIRNIPLHLSFQYFNAEIFEKFYEILLLDSTIQTHIVSLDLSNRNVWYQIRTFLSVLPLEQLSNLQTLHLSKIEQDNDGKEVLRLTKFSHSPFYYFTNWSEEYNTIFISLSIDTIHTLSISTIPSNLAFILQFPSIINLIISYCSLKDLSRFFTHVPKLENLEVNVVFREDDDDEDDATIKPFVIDGSVMHLKQIRINIFEGEFDELEALLNQSKNLQSLTISTIDNFEIIDADRWQQLITSSLPCLRRFNFRFLVTYTDDDNLTVDGTFEQFQSDFWRHQHNWRIVCESYGNQASIYSMPYAFTRYTLQSTCRKAANRYGKVTDLTLYLEQVVNFDEHQFPNVQSIKFESLFDEHSDEYLGKHVQYPTRTAHVDVSSLNEYKARNILSRLATGTSQLVSIKIHRNLLAVLFANEELRELLKKIIRKLNIVGIHGTQLIKYHELKIICKMFTNIEEFTCDVLDTTSLFQILLALSTLSNMKLCCLTSFPSVRRSFWLKNYGRKLKKYPFTINFLCGHSCYTEIGIYSSDHENNDVLERIEDDLFLVILRKS